MAHGSLLLSDSFLVNGRKNVQPEIQTTLPLDGCSESIRLRGDAQAGVCRETSTELKTQNTQRQQKSQKENRDRLCRNIFGQVRVSMSSIHGANDIHCLGAVS